MAWDKTVPFDKDGNMLSWCMPDPQWRDKTIEMRPQAEMVLELTYVGYRKGRSSALLIFKDPQGAEYPFFMVDVDQIVPHLVRGKTHGRFIPTKRGQNYGLRIVEIYDGDAVHKGKAKGSRKA